MPGELIQCTPLGMGWHGHAEQVGAMLTSSISDSVRLPTGAPNKILGPLRSKPRKLTGSRSQESRAEASGSQPGGGNCGRGKLSESGGR